MTGVADPAMTGGANLHLIADWSTSAATPEVPEWPRCCWSASTSSTRPGGQRAPNRQGDS
jgi:hypothetical protein